VLPLLYLHRLSTGDFVPALGEFLGSDKGLSSSTVTKLAEMLNIPAIMNLAPLPEILSEALL
jgi:hypothetical protein